MNEPTFLLVGAPKCGTTSIHAALDEHPDVFVTRVKEPGFFLRPTTRDEFDDYLSLFFAGSAGHRHRGEATPWYVYQPTDQVIGHLSEKPLIVISTRDPIERSWSHYRDQVRVGAEDRPFTEAIAAELRAIDEAAIEQIPLQQRYLWCSLLEPHIERWRSAVGPDRVCVVDAAELSSGGEGWAKLAQHLDLDDRLGADGRSNVGGAPLFPAIQRLIVDPPFIPADLRPRLKRSRLWPAYLRAAQFISDRNRRSGDPELLTDSDRAAVARAFDQLA